MTTLIQNSNQKDPKRVASAALQAFFNLVDRWGLSVSEQRTLLGSPAESTFFKWKPEKTARRSPDRDHTCRMSGMVGRLFMSMKKNC